MGENGEIGGEASQDDIKFPHAISRARHAPPQNVKAPGTRLLSYNTDIKPAWSILVVRIGDGFFWPM